MELLTKEGRRVASVVLSLAVLGLLSACSWIIWGVYTLG